jgi:hypothetical protein
MRAFEALAKKNKGDDAFENLAPHSFNRRVVVIPSGRSPDLAYGNRTES